MNKKAQSAGWAWILGLMMLFVLGIGFIITNQVLTNHILPISDNLISDSPYLNITEKTTISERNDKYMAYWGVVPIIFVFIIVIFILISAFTSKPQEY